MAIQPVPALVLASEFPTNADRTAGVWNAKAQAWANSENAMVTNTRDIALVTHNNAVEAKAAADAAVPAAAQAVAARDAAQLSADQSALSADQSVTARNQAVPAAAQALDAAQRAEDAAASIQDGPVTSVNSKTGVVNIGIADVVDPGDIVAYGSTKEEARNKIDATNGVIRRTERAASQQLTAQDLAHLIDITSGTFTQTFAAPSTLGGGWWCYLQNSGQGDITLQAPSGSTIDGLTSYVMYSGECRLLQCDGSVIRSIIITPMNLVKRTSFDFIKPPGYRAFDIDMRGATGGGGSGGAGAQASNDYHAGGGGGSSGGFGGRWTARFLEALLQNTSSFVVGAGGLGGPGVEVPPGTGLSVKVDGTTGSVGGDTSVTLDGVTFKAIGGSGGDPGKGTSGVAGGSPGAARPAATSSLVGSYTAVQAAGRYGYLAGNQLASSAAGVSGTSGQGGSEKLPGGPGGPASADPLGAGITGAGGAGGPSIRSGSGSVSQPGLDGVSGMVVIKGVL